MPNLRIALDTFDRFPNGNLTTDTLENLILFAAHHVVRQFGRDAHEAWRVIDELGRPCDTDIDFLDRFYRAIALRNQHFADEVRAAVAR